MQRIRFLASAFNDMQITALVAVFATFAALSAGAQTRSCALPQFPDGAAFGSHEYTRAERAYRKYFNELEAAAYRRDVSAVEACCVLSTDAPSTIPCAFMRYMAGERTQAAQFLAGTPQYKSENDWLWRWDALIARTGEAVSYPDGFAARYIDEVFALIKNERTALSRVFSLFRYADGEYAQYIRDKFVQLLEREPTLVVSRADEFVRDHDSIERALEPYPEIKPELMKVYRAECERVRSQACGQLLKVIAGAGSRRNNKKR